MAKDRWRDRARREDGTPLAGLCDGSFANRMMLIEILCERWRKRPRYCRLLQYALSRDAHHRKIPWHAKAMSALKQIGASERNIQRATDFFVERGILVKYDRRAENGSCLPPEAELIWDAVLDHLGVVERDAVPAAPIPADDLPDGPGSAAGRPASSSRGRHSNGRAARAATQSSRGGVNSRTDTTPGVSLQTDTTPPGSSWLPGTMRSPPHVLACVRARLRDCLLITDTDVVDDSKSVDQTRVRADDIVALAGAAGHLLWPRGLYGDADGWRSQRTLYAAAWLALTEFSRAWLLDSAQAVVDAAKGASPIRDRRAYLVQILREKCHTVELIGESAADVPKSWFGAVMGIAERVVLPILRPLTKRRAAEPGGEDGPSPLDWGSLAPDHLDRILTKQSYLRPQYEAWLRQREQTAEQTR